jgi:hypothetical protein
MIARAAAWLALLGGVIWLVKVLLIWQNGGTNTTGGVIGVLFVAGAVCISSAAAVLGWQLSSAFHPVWRIAALVVAVVAVVALVDLPILLGWLVLGHTWLAEELGIVLTAIVAAVFGMRALGTSGNGLRRTAHTS